MIEKIKALCLKYKEVLLYLIFGGLTTVVSLVTFWLAGHPLGLNTLIANVISWICVAMKASRLRESLPNSESYTSWNCVTLRLPGSTSMRPLAT